LVQGIAWPIASRLPSLSRNHAALAAPLAPIVTNDLRDSIDGGQARHVVILKHDAAASQRLDRRLDVFDLPGHLRELAG